MDAAAAAGAVSVVTHLFIAPAKGAPVKSVPLVDAIAGQGLEGDRYCEARNRRGAAHEVTLVQIEHIEAFTRATHLALTPEMPRRNIVTRGVDLNALVGRRFSLGEATLEGLELCEPCGLFARRTHREVRKWFEGKGGLRARIVAGGVIRVGDAVVPLALRGRSVRSRVSAAAEAPEAPPGRATAGR
ncbi:MAG TPA: MOSC domain-containing protein [Usitatibacter sp.]|nr:MOSC domain-containing protein [Usitatibacter sp.]